MKQIKEFERLDVYKLTEPVKLDTYIYTMYFAPKQTWDKKSLDILESEEKVFVGKGVALMLREKSYVLTGTEEGIVCFPKNPDNIRPLYKNEYPFNDLYNSALDMIDLFKRAGLV